MQSEELVKFFREIGADVGRTASCWWYEEQRGTRVYCSFPSHRLVEPSSAEIKEVFKRLPRAIALRFVTAASDKCCNTGRWVARAPYDLETLSSKARNQVRQGLTACKVRRLSWAELIENAREAHEDTMNRHGRAVSKTLGLSLELADCPAYEAWGAFIDGTLAAYAVTLTVEEWVAILVHRSVSANLKARPNNALIFSLAREVLARPHVSTLSYGIEPLAALKSLEHFKAGMGFTREAVGQRIILAPRFRPVVNRITVKPLQALAELMPNNTRLQKLAGFCNVASYQ